MPSELETIFTQLGLTQYLDSFIEQGFDEWDIILDIQESDLDALGVKLGHRRKLQRRIANDRGISPGTALVPHVRPAGEEAKHEGVRSEQGQLESQSEIQVRAVTKRKYRRHPKPDENAPERPPSAYVLFSNKMRESLKSQNLSFTEIAKLVGENWQSLPSPEKEEYENQANAAKERYHRELAEYKKTPEHGDYMQYLREFKATQAKLERAKNGPKRAKLLNGNTTSGVTTPGTIISTENSSGSGSEPPPSREERMDSITSITESQHSITPTLASQANSNDEAMQSPRGGYYEPNSPGESYSFPSRRQGSWHESVRVGDSSHMHLPSLSDMLDDGRRSAPHAAAAESNHYSGFVAANRSNPEHSNTITTTAASRGPPLLRYDHSSNSSVGSISPGVSFARTPGEGPLPIHALLSHQTPSRPGRGALGRGSPNSLAGGATPSPTDLGKSPFGQSTGPRGYGT
ncbi:hypothetical protein BGZ63DRAFT_400379 [Mariannaea sp. PMI_226]|nr:hypothetical protein BGZ63DRAFT_400379 [Mariannaea sp. PMI_226]